MIRRFPFLSCVLPMLFHAPDDPPSGNGSLENDEPPRPNVQDVAARYSGDAVRMAGEIVNLESDKYKLREQRRTLTAERDALKAKQVPEGAVVLTADEAKAWSEYSQLGKPDELKTQVATGRAAQAELTGFKRTQMLDEAAKGVNFKPGMLKLLATTENVQKREADVQQQDGSIAKVTRYVVVQGEGDSATETELREYFKAKGDDVLATLDVGDADFGNANNFNASNFAANARMVTPQNGTTYPAQGAGAPPQNKAAAAPNVVKDRYTKPSERGKAKTS